MKNLRWLTWLLVLLGCTSVRNEKTKPLEEGLTVLSASETKLSLAYKSGEEVIYMDALRGNPTPEMYQQDPLAPKFEVDVRFADAQGRIFYTAKGGDEWQDPSWREELELQQENFRERASNEHLLFLAAKAAATLDIDVASQVGPETAMKLEPMLRPVRGFAAEAPMLYFEQKLRLHAHLKEIGLMGEDEDNPVLTGPNGEVIYGSGGTGCDAWTTWPANYYYMAVHDADTLVIARHSVTRLYSWQGYWLQVHDNCNHGRCAWEMSQKCFLQYYEAIEDYKPSWELQSCGTGYEAFSNDGHNCHDDTRVQLANFVYGNGHNMGPGSRFWCYGDDDSDISSWPGDQSGSPECNGSANNGYNHPHMCRYQGTHGYNSAGYCYCDQLCLSYNDCCVDGPW